MNYNESEAIQGIARTFVEARRSRGTISRYPGTAPQTLDAAYAIQDAALAMDTGTVAGWKLGRIPSPHNDDLGADRLAGPAFADAIIIADQSDEVVAMPVFTEGFAAAEAEFMLRIGTPPAPDRSDYSPAEARSHIDVVRVGIEIASSPYPRINADGPTVTISDYGNNNGLVLGALITDWQQIDLGGWPISTSINNTVIADGYARDMLDGPFGSAAFLFNLLARRGIALSEGQWISSGALTGVHPVKPGDVVEARFGSHYAVRCSITAY